MPRKEIEDLDAELYRKARKQQKKQRGRSGKEPLNLILPSSPTIFQAPPAAERVLHETSDPQLTK